MMTRRGQGLAERIRAAYARERGAYERGRGNRGWRLPRRWDGTPDLVYEDDPDAVVERGRGSAWDKLAQTFAQQRLDPDLYVRAQFEPEMLRLYRPPEPPQLTSPGRLEDFRRFQANLGASLDAAWREQVDALRRETAFRAGVVGDDLRALAGALGALATALSPLFRFVVAQRYGLAALARRVRRAAAQQYLAYSEWYDRSAWAEHLPESFRRDAARIADEDDADGAD